MKFVVYSVDLLVEAEVAKVVDLLVERLVFIVVLVDLLVSKNVLNVVLVDLLVLNDVS